MGDVVNTRRLLLRPRGAAWLALSVGSVLLVASCSSSAPRSASAPAGATPEPSAAASAAPAAVQAAQIRTLELREEAPGVALVLAGDRPLVWTTFRDAEGRLVLELPNSEPATSLASLAPEAGLVAEVEVAAEAGADRPLTRLTITTRGDAEHALAADGDRLVLRLVPVGTAVAASSPAVADEPLPAGDSTADVAAVTPVSASPAPTPVADLGTAESPREWPAPSGSSATRLDTVTVNADATATEIAVRGDGGFRYSTFVLDSPPRFVIDLKGVTNASGSSVVPVSSAYVERVRVAQFKTSPEAVSRVVLDLRQSAAPRLHATPDGLVVQFGAGANGDASSATASAAPARATTMAEDLEAAAPPRRQEASEPPAADDEQASAPSVAPLLPVPAEASVETVAEAPAEAFEPEQAAAAPVPEEVAPVAVAQAPAPTVRPTAPAPTPVRELEAASAPVAPTSADDKEAVLQSFREHVATGSSQHVYVGEPISMSLKDADIKDVLRTFAKISGLNVVVQPGVKGSVTVELENVPWDQALEQVLKINGLGMELEGNILRIAPNSQLQAEAQAIQDLKKAQSLSVPLETVLKKISYAWAGDMQSVLASVMSQRGSVTVDARTNTLIIKELPTYLKTVLSVIDNLDTPAPQVMIEARIVETTKRFGRTLGVTWGFTGAADAQHGNTTGLVFPNSVTGSGGVNLATGGQNGFLNLTLGNILDTFKLNASLQAAENEGLINVLSAPKVTTLDNFPAEIQSGLQIPVQTISNNTVTVQFVNATLRLQVIPHVTAAGTILMAVNVQKRNPELAFAVVGATNAPINTREATTRVLVRDGGTTVIGGIYEVTNDSGEDRVPGLANVPVLKHLFKNRRSNQENKELLIFITPRVVRL
jgi:type IV pilus assembly protein PilQ